jgi:putative transposase
MARSIRIEFPGAFYHVMARGNRRDAIFKDDLDRSRFVETLGEACGMTGWRVHAFVLLSNHYHLRLETPEPNLVAGMKWLQNTVTRRFNVRHRAWGRIIVIDSVTSFPSIRIDFGFAAAVCLKRA